MYTGKRSLYCMPTMTTPARNAVRQWSHLITIPDLSLIARVFAML
jgi:hypothetical protein